MIINDFGMPFNDVGNDRLYAASEWAEYFKNLVGNGVVGEVGNELTVIQQTVPNKTVIVSTGAIMINGYARVIGTPFNLALADNTSGNPRVDRIIARLNITDRKIEIVVKQGTPASSPVVPTLTQNATTWEISIASVNVANGFSSIINSNITDERTYMTYKDRVLNERMATLEGEVDNVNARMDVIDPAKYYGKYSQMSGGDIHTGAAGAGIIAFATEDNDDFGAINVVSYPKRITIPSGVYKVKFYWKGTLQGTNYAGTTGNTISLYKNGVLLTTIISDYGQSNHSSNRLVYTELIAVNANDYFEVYAGSTTPYTDSNTTISSGSIFGMEVLG